jgi:hypothetical protein
MVVAGAWVDLAASMAPVIGRLASTVELWMLVLLVR